VTDPLDRARAEAIHACASTVRRALALERDLDRINDMVDRAGVGRLVAVASTLAEYEARISELEIRMTTQERTHAD
jgi:hypothetical protein